MRTHKKRELLLSVLYLQSILLLIDLYIAAFAKPQCLGWNNK